MRSLWDTFHITAESGATPIQTVWKLFLLWDLSLSQPVQLQPQYVHSGKGFIVGTLRWSESNYAKDQK